MSEQTNFVRPVPPVSSRTEPLEVEESSGIIVMPEGETTITPLQNTAYLGILASICIFGFAAVISFQRGVQQSKKLKPVFFGFGIVLVALAAHTAVTSRMFSSYLNGELTEASLFYRTAGWVIFAPVLAWLRLSLFGFGRGSGINQIIDSSLFAATFLIAAIGLQTNVSPTAAIIFGVLSLALYLVIIVRSFGLKKKGMEALPGFIEGPHLLIWNTLVFGPILIPLLALARSFGLGHDWMHLLLTSGESAIMIMTVVGVALCSTRQFDAVDGGAELDVQVDADIAAGGDADDPFGDAALVTPAAPVARPAVRAASGKSGSRGVVSVRRETSGPVMPTPSPAPTAPEDASETEAESDFAAPAESFPDQSPEAEEADGAPQTGQGLPQPKPSVKPPPKPKRRF